MNATIFDEAAISLNTLHFARVVGLMVMRKLNNFAGFSDEDGARVSRVRAVNCVLRDEAHATGAASGERQLLNFADLSHIEFCRRAAHFPLQLE